MALSQPKPHPGVGPAGCSRLLYWSGDLFGNNNYQTTGDNYTAQQFGMAGITFFNVAEKTNSGNYGASVLPPANSSNSNEAYAPASQNWTVHYYSANGTETANNNNMVAEILRVQIWGV